MNTKSLHRLRLPVAAWCGVLAAAVALGTGHLLAALLEPRASPFLAVGNSAIDLTPEPVKQFAIRTFGQADKIALLGGMAIVIALLAAAAGLLSRRDARPGVALIGAFGLLGVAAVLSRPDVGALGVLAPLIAALAGIAAFRLLHRTALAATDLPAPPRTEHDPHDTLEEPYDPELLPETTTPDRRRFLVSSVAVAATAGVTGAAGSLLTGGRDAEASRRTVAQALAASPAQTVPAGADFAAAGTPSFLTANRDFYRIDTALSIPRVELADWRLRVHGMVERELDLGFTELRRFPQVTRTITMTCVSNDVGGPYISTAEFTGVFLRDVLLAAGVRPGSEQVFSTSADGFTAGTPVEALLDPERGALLAYGMNGEPLPAEHGFPVRMVTPGLYGYVSATKWLTDLELTTFDKPAYWIERGWGRFGPIKVQSRIDRPGGFGRIPAGRTTVAGIAWAQPIGIERVEVRVDRGPWQQAQLSTEVNRQTWRMWRTDVDLAPGGHTIECRATDHNGTTQTPQRAPVLPDGATGWHSVFCTAR
ncbi:molybdopterin-dependent oxidoreductase [Saccharopolyspora gloriosae]|uniref:DMSO/TMAO reductase YedYZ molybdopterin-dependent catalytic subunit n=1 Tax=Saccharopolyspora gloriosae TaxID=455344 RepID=A0A840NHI6_9PSEU|nr:DMSO/TMAO reductase YedYZ molybdopterin-dependent catalytic subunit [Saccharopolyspora gloriosae]